MMKVITYFIIIFQLISLKVLACKDDFVVNIAKHKIFLKVAASPKSRNIGLSGAKSLKMKHGMFFYYPKTRWLAFWMPDTYFNLDIFFLNSNLQIIAIERNMPAHPGRKTIPKISQTKRYFAKYVLELSSSDLISKKIKNGDRLIFNCSNYFQQIKQGIRLKK